MTARPRSLVWLSANGHLFPQIWFDAPPAGYIGIKPVAERKLEPGEYALTLDQLVAMYPGADGNAMIETWKAVVGYEGQYEVSDLGRVRSLDRIITRTVRWKSGIVKDISFKHRGQMLRPGIASNGYLTVSIKRISRCVQILVLTAFVGPAPEGLECCHGDGNRQNNRLSNLRWDTHASNLADMAIHGTKLIGSAYPTAKLNDDTARRIRELRGIHPQSELAKMFNVSPAAVQAVHDGRTWKHVGDQ